MFTYTLKLKNFVTCANKSKQMSSGAVVPLMSAAIHLAAWQPIWRACVQSRICTQIVEINTYSNSNLMTALPMLACSKVLVFYKQFGKKYIVPCSFKVLEALPVWAASDVYFVEEGATLRAVIAIYLRTFREWTFLLNVFEAAKKRVPSALYSNPLAIC